MTLTPGSRWPARVAVVGLHLAVFALLWQHRPPPLQGPRERRIVTLRLVPLPDRRPPPVTLPARVPPRAAPLPSRRGNERAPEDLPTAAPPLPPAPTAAAVTAPTPPVEPLRAPLRLTLPPGYAASSAAARNPALSDPRSNTPRPTLEDRIADATGGASEWVEEKTSDNRLQSVGALGDRRTVMRRGDTCVEIIRSRIAEVDQFNGNVAPRAVQMVGKPYKCK
ncbi:MAG: hypothetical protein EKK53_01880 [Burkholderiales bacterium]|nr:MAG: hypothetical protein EKK53_01880 [Burkholderiales bacterium]